MVLRSDVTGTRPITQTDASPAITSVTNASQETLNRLALISVGKQFQAQVLSRLNDGTFLVRVADTTARMSLPDATKAGDSVTLTLLTPNPRPTFVLGDASKASEQAIANLLQNAEAAQVGKPAVAAIGTQAASDTAADALPSSATATLSSAGRLVDNLLHAAQLDGAPSRILGSTPIAPSPLIGAEALAQSLRNTIEFSGVFYESHLAQWANGERPLETLMREPQAMLANTAPPSAHQAGQTSLIDMLRAIETAQQGLSSENAIRLALSNETAQLINLQLGALEQHRLAWRGELWPGQPFEWEVSEDTPGPDAQEHETTWRSQVKFDLPSLGPIEASIHLANGRVQMQIRTASDSTASLLRANGASLAQALDAAGSPLEALTVQKNEPA